MVRRQTKQHIKHQQTSSRVFRNMSDETVTIEDRCIIVDVFRPHAHLGVSSERRLECIRLIVSKNVEVPDGTTT